MNADMTSSNRNTILLTAAGDHFPVVIEGDVHEGYCGLEIVFSKKRSEVQLQGVKTWQTLHGSLFRCATVAQLTGSNDKVEIGSWRIQTITIPDEFAVLATTTNLPKRGRSTYRNYVFVLAPKIMSQTYARQRAESLMLALRS